MSEKIIPFILDSMESISLVKILSISVASSIGKGVKRSRFSQRSRFDAGRSDLLLQGPCSK